MQYLVTAEEMREYDKNTIEKIGIPGAVLMERAALTACEEVCEYWCSIEKGCRVLIMAGYGNNGGDGLALARLLCERGFWVDVWCVGDESKASAQWREQRRILEHFEVDLFGGDLSEGEPGGLLEQKLRNNKYDVCVDALFGVGLSREVTGGFREAVEYFNQLNGWKLALDVPSGMDSDSGRALGACVKADETVTFGFCKRGLVLYPGRSFAGRVKTVDIGIGKNSFFGKEPEMYTLDEPAASLLPVRCKNGNKGTFGKVLLVAGNVNMAGAAILSARAAYRTGAGMVKIISPEENRVVLQTTVCEALYGAEDALEDGLAWADVIAIGPGLGRDEYARRVLEMVILEGGKPLVVDADALNLLAEHFDRAAEALMQQGALGRKIIFTPHVGELGRLAGKTVAECTAEGAVSLLAVAREMAEKWHCVLVAKDAATLVCQPGRPDYVNTNGNNGMATAGSGDVLTGIIAALLAQGLDAGESAVRGVYLHGAAGDRAAERVGTHACTAGDMVEGLKELKAKVF